MFLLKKGKWTADKKVVKLYVLLFGKNIKTHLQKLTIGVVRSIMQQTPSTSISTMATLTTTIRLILIRLGQSELLHKN